MKKLIIVIGVILLFIVGTVLLIPQVLYFFPFTQKLALQLEGDQAAEFYFKKTLQFGIFFSIQWESIPPQAAATKPRSPRCSNGERTCRRATNS